MSDSIIVEFYGKEQATKAFLMEWHGNANNIRFEYTYAYA